MLLMLHCGEQLSSDDIHVRVQQPQWAQGGI